ncbi:MAG: DNA-binding domain-containing protein [Clostridiales bacterium]|nr:DNA-binding domain-containing protein [Clostridiales bacterium]
MKVFILDDDQNIIRILEQILTDKKLGNVVGTCNNSRKSIEHIKSLMPDIVIVDLLMPQMDGISLIEKVKEFSPEIKFIMISQVTSKDMISKAYEKGVNFYINKPINAVEVLNVLAEVINYMETEKRLKLIKNIIKINEDDIGKQKTVEDSVKCILKNIGIVGNTSTEEIVGIIEYMIENYNESKKLSVKDICLKFSSTPKTLEQKIRRIGIVGLENLAYLGIEDNLNDKFVEYSNTLYNFKDIKIEMDYIRGITDERGKVSVRKFLDGIIYYIKK